MKRFVSLFVQALNGYLLVASLLVSCTHIQLPHALHPEAELPSPTTLGEKVPETPEPPPSQLALANPTVTPRPAFSHVQYGRASWYGRPFHGRRTASGEVYNMYETTAAHRTVALGTHALVTNLNTGRAVQVRINDRGPMVRGRVLDLSYKAAQEIGMIAAGSTQVKIEFLAHRLTPSGSSQTASLASSLASTVGTVQPSWEPTSPVAPPVVMRAGTFLKAPHVVQTQQALAPGHVDVRVMTPSDNAPPWYRGRLGPLSNREDAEQKARQNIYQGYAAAVMAALRD